MNTSKKITRTAALLLAGAAVFSCNRVAPAVRAGDAPIGFAGVSYVMPHFSEAYTFTVRTRSELPGGLVRG